MKHNPIATTEWLAVRDALWLFRYANGRMVCESSLIDRLLEMGEVYGASGHWIAAELRKLHADLERMERFTPYAPGWFEALIGRLLWERNQVEDPTGLVAIIAEHKSMEIAATERRAQEFLGAVAGDRHQALQMCLSQIRGLGAAEASVLMQCALWMVREGWSVAIQRKAPVVEFGAERRKKA